MREARPSRFAQAREQLREFRKDPLKQSRMLWEAAKSERATPKQIGLAVALGVFCGCSPAWGARWALALGLATALRLNRLFSYIGSRIPSNFVTTAWVIVLEVQLAHKLRTGEFLSITAEEALEQWSSLLLDFCIGSVPVGVAFALFFGLLAYGIAALRDRRKAREPAPALLDHDDAKTPSSRST